MRLELNKVSAASARQLLDLIYDDPRVLSCSRDSGDDPARFGIVEVSFGLAIVLAGGTGAAFVADTLYKIRQRFRPFLILDLTQDQPVIHVIEDVPGMRGEILVRQCEGEEVRLEPTSDSAKIASTVLKAIAP